jgi:hypothetical protein
VPHVAAPLSPTAAAISSSSPPPPPPPGQNRRITLLHRLVARAVALSGDSAVGGAQPHSTPRTRNRGRGGQNILYVPVVSIGGV